MLMLLMQNIHRSTFSKPEGRNFMYRVFMSTLSMMIYWELK